MIYDSLRSTGSPIRLSCLGSPVVPLLPFFLGVPLLKPNSRKKGTLIIKGPLGNLVVECCKKLKKGVLTDRRQGSLQSKALIEP